RLAGRDARDRQASVPWRQAGVLTGARNVHARPRGPIELEARGGQEGQVLRRPLASGDCIAKGSLVVDGELDLDRAGRLLARGATALPTRAAADRGVGGQRGRASTAACARRERAQQGGEAPWPAPPNAWHGATLPRGAAGAATKRALFGVSQGTVGASASDIDDVSHAD